MMEMTFLGTGTGVPSINRGAPGIIIKIGLNILLFDLGPGVTRRLPEAGLTCNDIDYIFITHLHVDHIADFAPFVFASKYPEDPRLQELSIFGPIGIRDYYKHLLKLYENQIPSQKYILNVDEMYQDVVKKGNWMVESQPLTHFQNGIGFRTTDRDNKVVVYSGDTDYCQNLVELSMNADLLILECSFPEKVEGHLSPQYAGRVATEAGAKKLVLTHLYPVCDEQDIITMLKQNYKGEIIIAHDLMKLVI